MEQVYDLLDDVIDLHIHSSPDIFPRRVDDLEAAQDAKSVGMKAILIKCHVAQTADRAALVAKAVPGVKVFGSLCLDVASAGGLNLDAVKTAIALGAKEIWMPTIDAENHIRYYGGDMAKAIPVVRRGELVPEMVPILMTIAEADVILGTGHLAPNEIEVLVEEACKYGVKKILVTHPEFEVVNMSVDTMKRLTKKDAYLEFCFFSILNLGFMGKRNLRTAKEVADMIREVGAGSVVMSSDYGNVFLPPPIEGYRMYMTVMKAEGIPQQDLDLMTKTNPEKLLGI